MNAPPTRVLVLSGGVGGAKLAYGCDRIANRVDLTVLVNVGDDFEHLGLYVSPDIDTVLYTLGGIANRSRGWGIENESWRTMERLRELGGEDWFSLGDLDIATHLFRTGALASGLRLSEVTARLRERLGVRSAVLPATDDRVRTRLHTEEGELDFQDYFVRRGCAPSVQRISYAGIESAMLSPEVKQCLAADHGAFDAVILAPSNPFLSLAPMLDIPGLAQRLRRSSDRVVAVSPIIAGEAVKGPAAKLMAELGLEPSARDWALHVDGRYEGLVDSWVLDERDTEAAAQLAAMGLRTRTGRTLMRSDAERVAFADWLVRDVCGA